MKGGRNCDMDEIRERVYTEANKTLTGWLPLTGNEKVRTADTLGGMVFDRVCALCDYPCPPVLYFHNANASLYEAEWLDEKTLRVEDVDVEGLVASIDWGQE